jgi:hypothetical protein
MNKTRPHCVNQMGKTHSKPLAARHGRGTAWARHGNGMLCVNPPLHCSLEHKRNYTSYRDRLFIRFLFLTHLSSYSPKTFSYSSVYYPVDNHLSYHIISSPTFLLHTRPKTFPFIPSFRSLLFPPSISFLSGFLLHYLLLLLLVLPPLL